MVTQYKKKSSKKDLLFDFFIFSLLIISLVFLWVTLIYPTEIFLICILVSLYCYFYLWPKILEILGQSWIQVKDFLENLFTNLYYTLDKIISNLLRGIVNENLKDFLVDLLYYFCSLIELVLFALDENPWVVLWLGYCCIVTVIIQIIEIMQNKR